MATIRVVGPYDAKAHPGVIRKMITRNSSPVGNPFLIGVDGDRHEVCKLFEDLVWVDWEAHCDAPPAVMDWLEQRVHEHRQGFDLELCCRCRPKARPDVPCHGNTLRDWIFWVSEQRDSSEKFLQCLTVDQGHFSSAKSAFLVNTFAII